MPDLLTLTDLPNAFTYPPEFVRVVELGLTNLEPWEIVQGEELREHHEGIRRRYRRNLVLFALRHDTIDTACWDLGRGNIAIVHEFATPGWEQRGTHATFYDWFRRAVEDFITFED